MNGKAIWATAAAAALSWSLSSGDFLRADEADAATLKRANLPTTDAAILSFLAKQTLSDEELQSAGTLLRQLGEESFARREEAMNGLRRHGSRVRGLLEQARRRAGREIADRAALLLRELPAGPTPEVLTAAIRLVGERKPKDAVKVLFAFAPTAPFDPVQRELTNALARLAKDDPAGVALLVAGLSDPQPERRAAAAEALCRARRIDVMPSVRAVLQDADPQVAFRAGIALAEGHDKAALPVLITLIPEMTRGERWRIEDLLTQVAGEKTPVLSAGDDASAARGSRELWMRWWREHGAGVDLAKTPLNKPLQGRLLVLTLERFDGVGRVQELGPKADVAWTIDNLRQPLSAEWAGADRVLIAEYDAERVTERDGKGEILWEKKLGQPVVAAQRLANGNTFIACRNRLMELRPDGKEVYSLRRSVRDVVAARRFAEGPIIVLTDTGTCEVVDVTGKLLTRFEVKGPHAMGTRIDALPGRRILLPISSQNRVVEYDAEGKVAWQTPIEKPTAATRLPNGDTLAVSAVTKRVTQLDRSGNVVWQWEAAEAPVSASRR
jgi:hypothetical protein